MKIDKLKARTVFDSRGNPTVEVSVTCGKFTGSAIVPSGASTGRYEAYELRDMNNKEFFGKGVFNAVSNVYKIEKKIKGMDVYDQAGIDNEMLMLDNTPNKSRLGANAILSVSLACARTASMCKGIELYEYIHTLGKFPKMKLPVPFANIINGGKHAGNSLKFQEFMIAPVKAKSFFHGSRMISEVYHTLKNILIRNYGKSAINVGDEGGFAPPIVRSTQALRLIEKAVHEAGYSKEIRFAMDAAASEFYNKGLYNVDGKKFKSEELINYYEQLLNEYPEIISIEDPFDQDDYTAFYEFTKQFKNKGVEIVGDDLLVSNINKIRTAKREELCNALLLKVNQIGTLSEAIEAYNFAKKSKWNVMVSHRSGESEDTFISDLSVGLSSGQIKLGAIARGERTCKYNRLIRIEEYLGSKGRYGL